MRNLKLMLLAAALLFVSGCPFGGNMDSEDGTALLALITGSGADETSDALALADAYNFSGSLSVLQAFDAPPETAADFGLNAEDVAALAGI